MSSTLRETAEVPPPVPTAPTVEAWRAMTPAERERFLVAANEALTTPPELMSEGQPHQKAKSRAIDALGLHFKTIGRAVYLAEELSVVYPGAKPFAPDIVAVLDVEPPEEDERLAWVVADEGKGVDLVLEVLHRGDRHKDLVENVERYAQLGIAEYFVYDRQRQQIHGYRLPAPGASCYQRIVRQLGHYPSRVLGLDLALIGDRLRFLSGEAELPLSADLIGRLQDMVASLTAKAEQTEAQAEQVEAKVQRAEAQRVDGFREGLLAILDVRGLPCSDEARARIAVCTDAPMLRRWLLRAKTAASVEEVLSEPPPAQ